MGSPDWSLLFRDLGAHGITSQLRAMASRASQLKKEGNELYKAHDYHGAAAKYSTAISERMADVLLNRSCWELAAPGGGLIDWSRVPFGDLHKAASDLFDVLGQLCNNRAACNLAVGNVRGALYDTAGALHTIEFLHLVDDENVQEAERQHGVGIAFMGVNNSHMRQTMVKARARRAKAYESVFNTAAACTLYATAVGYSNLPEYGDVCVDPEGSLKARMRDLCSQRHPPFPPPTPAAGSRVDWSLVTPGTWNPWRATGAVPPPLVGFSAGYYAGNNSIYVLAGQKADLWHKGNSRVYVLNLASRKWRTVEAKGSHAPPPSGLNTCSTSCSIWRTLIIVYAGRDGGRPGSVHFFDMETETWQKGKQAQWPMAFRDAKVPMADTSCGGHSDYAVAVCGDILFIHGGLVNGETDVGTLMSYHLVEGTWKLLHHSTLLSHRWPDSRHAHQMWALDGRLYVFGGKTRRGSPLDTNYERMIKPELYFWSFDLASLAWHNEASFVGGDSCSSNLPGSRAEFAATLLPAPPAAGSGGAGATTGPPTRGPGTRVVLFGGYTTNVRYSLMPLGVEAFSYLADCFVWEEATGWKYVLCKRSPPWQMAGVLVHVPPAAQGPDGLRSAPAAEEGGPGFPGAQGRSSASGQAGRLLALGGTKGGGGVSEGVSFAEVWELSLATPGVIKGVDGAACYACGKATGRLRQCAGSCGGAIATCGKECHLKAWNEMGHKHWCKAVK